MLPGVHDQGTVGRREYLSLHVCHTLSELTAHQAESQTVNTFSELQHEHFLLILIRGYGKKRDNVHYIFQNVCAVVSPHVFFIMINIAKANTNYKFDELTTLSNITLSPLKMGFSFLRCCVGSIIYNENAWNYLERTIVGR